MMGEGAPVRKFVGELARRTFAQAHQGARAGVRRGAQCILAQATRLPVSLDTSYLCSLSPFSRRSRRACPCEAQRARQDARLAAIRAFSTTSTHLLQLATARVLWKGGLARGRSSHAGA